MPVFVHLTAEARLRSIRRRGIVPARGAVERSVYAGSPPCACICCERGQYGIRRLLGKVEEAEAADRRTPIVLFGRDERSDRRVERLRKERRGGIG